MPPDREPVLSAKEAGKYLGGLALAVILLWLVFRQSEPRDVWRHLRGVSVPGLTAAAALILGHNLFRVWRWRALLQPLGRRTRFQSLIVAVVLGHTVSMAVPGRFGELVRPALLAGRERIALGPCLGSALGDRLLDAVTIVVLFVAGVNLAPLKGEATRHIALIQGGSLVLLVVVGLALLLLLVVSASTRRLETWLEDRGRLLSWSGRSILALSSGVESLKNPRLLGQIVLHSFVIWMMVAAGTWVGVRACGVSVPPGAILVIMPLLALGIALPTPGGTGGYHAALAFGLSGLFEVDQQTAVAASILVHLAAVLPVIVLGAGLLTVDHSWLADLREAARQARA